jgi:alcohol dehydrogenase class IV
MGPMLFEFATAGRILFGEGTLREAGGIARRYGDRALIVTGGTPGRASPLEDVLRQSGVSFETVSIPGEPTTGQVTDGVEAARRFRPHAVIGFGGGSALDAAKAIAALLANPGDIFDYLEVIGAARPLTVKPLPCIAIPTTAGTGSEVTRNAVIKSEEHGVKVSIRHPDILPCAAIIDPELTLELPPAVTAAAGLDAFTQVIEPYVSRRANPLTDAICRDGIRLAAGALRKAFTDGHDAAARRDMCLASLYGGMALANAGLGAVHGFAGPVGGMFPAPHGVICARLLPAVIETNIRALQAREPDSPALCRYDEIARLVTGCAQARADDGIRWIQRLCEDLRIPPLGACGIRATHVPDLVRKAAESTGMKTNPITLTGDELAAILTQVL